MKKYIFIVLRVIIAITLIQTLRFKLTGHPDSMYIFSKVGLEPYGRIGIGLMELLAGILLLIPRTVWLGASITAGIIGGAVLMHLTVLGIDVKGDNGLLFYTAVFILLSALCLLWFYRKDIPIIGTKL